MLKFVIAIAISIIFFCVGWQKIRAINQHNQPTIHRIVDYDPTCNETNYLLNGFSLELDAEALYQNTDDRLEKEERLLFDTNRNFLTIDDGQTLNSILRPRSISEPEIIGLSTALEPHLLARDLASGDFYRLDLLELDKNTNLVRKLEIRKLDSHRTPILYTIERTSLDPNNTSFKITVQEALVTEEVSFISVKVEQTLYAAFNTIPFGAELMQRLLAIFTWDLKLPEGVLRGDEIDIIVSKKFALGEFIGFGMIQSVCYRQKQRTLFATFFTSKDKKIRGFFDEKGSSVEKEFLTIPVFETTATSNQMWRLHPIRKIRIRHNGIDYRGTIGTDFFSIADGTVVEKRYDENVGNMIRIGHKYGIHSEYFHAHTLEGSLKVGDSVKRGQILGTIGRTGKLCTGPHLHMGLYRLHKGKRKYLEFLSLKTVLKPAPNINASYMAEYQAHLNSQLAKLEK